MIRCIVLLLSAIIMLCASGARAAALNWIQWNYFYHTGEQGYAEGYAFPPGHLLGIAYVGELQSLQFGYPSWTPTSTFDGRLSVAPQPSQGMIEVMGGTASISTIHLPYAIFNPVVAIWSLGSFDEPATLIFDQPFMIPASGGPSSEHGGSALFVNDNTVTGWEGNGVLLFPGRYTSISWINPTIEDSYGFTVGFMGANVCGVIPGCGCFEPMSLALLGSGLAGLIFVRRRRHGSLFAARFLGA